jgi:hypothetical protein
MMHALWWDHWSNIQHDDIDVWKARILTLLASRLGHDAVKTSNLSLKMEALPGLLLTERGLFSLLHLCWFWRLYRSHPHETLRKSPEGLLKYSPLTNVVADDKCKYMEELAESIVFHLPPAVCQQWWSFKLEYDKLWAQEVGRRHDYDATDALDEEIG